MVRYEEELCRSHYFVLLHSVSEMLDLFITDFIPAEVKSGECLWKKRVNGLILRRAMQVLLLCFVVEHWLNVGLLHHRFVSN